MKNQVRLLGVFLSFAFAASGCFSESGSKSGFTSRVSGGAQAPNSQSNDSQSSDSADLIIRFSSYSSSSRASSVSSAPTSSSSALSVASSSVSSVSSVSSSVAPPAAGVQEKDRFGFNSYWMFAVLNNAPSSTMAELTAALKQLNQPVIRFPGGTVGRSYHFYKTGYDGTQAGATENYIVPFVKIVSPPSTPGLAKISYVLNIDEHFKHLVYTGSDEALISENLAGITYLLDHGLSIPLVELGNEYSLTPELFWRMGNNPLKTIDTVQENINILTEIKLTYTNDQAYTEAHLKDGLDKLQNLFATYQSRINALFQSRGLPRPAYGVPIHPVRTGNKYYGDTRFFLQYYNTRVKNMPNIDALIPHVYLSFASGQSATALADMRSILQAQNIFFAGRRFWVTEFNANPTVNGKNNDDTQEQIDTLNQMIQAFRDTNTDYYMLHQIFTNTSGYPPIYKSLTTTSKPVNGMIGSSGTIVPNPIYGKNLFYSPMFCWTALLRGASASQYAQIQSAYGCK